MQTSDEMKGKSLGQVISVIAARQGVVGLWTGVGPTCARAAFLTAGEKVTYDQVRSGVFDALPKNEERF